MDFNITTIDDRVEVKMTVRASDAESTFDSLVYLLKQWLKRYKKQYKKFKKDDPVPPYEPDLNVTMRPSVPIYNPEDSTVTWTISFTDIPE